MATRLFEYGIQTDESDYHVHVCPLVHRIYVFPTSAGLKAIQIHKLPSKPAYQMVNGRSEMTAQGYAMPIGFIVPIRECELPDELWQFYPIEDTQTTFIKGKQAHLLVQKALYEGLVPLFFDPDDVTDVQGQFAGNDLRIKLDKTVQVKCDYKGGSKTLGGTGNLYLQTHESNPNKVR